MVNEKEDEKKAEEQQKRLDELTKDKAPEAFEDNPERVKFVRFRDERVKDLKAVLYYLIREKQLKVTKAIKYEKAVEYFRAVDFHMLVLQNEAEILALIPNLTKDDMITELKTVKDSSRLGQLMMFVGLLSKARTHPNLKITKGT